MSKEELKEMLKLYTKQDLWEFNQIKAKKQIELMAQIKEKDQIIQELETKAVAELEKVKEYMEKKLVEFDNTEMKIIMGLYAFNIENQIDQQIKLLKGEK